MLDDRMDILRRVEPWLERLGLGAADLAGSVGDAGGRWLTLELASPAAWLQVALAAASAQVPAGLAVGVTGNFTSVSVGRPRALRWHFHRSHRRLFLLPEELGEWERVMGDSARELFGRTLGA